MSTATKLTKSLNTANDDEDEDNEDDDENNEQCRLHHHFGNNSSKNRRGTPNNVFKPLILITTTKHTFDDTVNKFVFFDYFQLFPHLHHLTETNRGRCICSRICSLTLNLTLTHTHTLTFRNRPKQRAQNKEGKLKQ